MTLCVLVKCYQDSQGTFPKAAPTVHYPEDEHYPSPKFRYGPSTKGVTSQTTRQNYQL